MDEYYSVLSNHFGERLHGLVVYGSFPYNPSSDFDSCVIVTHYTQNDIKFLVEAVESLNKRYCLLRDVEIPYENKLIYSIEECQSLLNDFPFHYNEFDGKYEITDFIESVEYLCSSEARRRLLLNIMTTESCKINVSAEFLGISDYCFRKLALAVKDYFGCKTLLELRDALITNPWTSARYKNYLGYSYKEENYLYSKLLSLNIDVRKDYSYISQGIIKNILETGKVTDSYRKQLAILNKRGERLFSSFIAPYNDCINSIFDITTGIQGIFDSEIGGVTISDNDWEVSSSLFKILFQKKISNLNIYLLEKNDCKLLRGAITYYYFACVKNEYSSLRSSHVLEWIDEYRNFFTESFNLLLSMENLSIDDRIFLLGVYDNLRNVSLIMLNAYITVNYKSVGTCLIHLDETIGGILKWSNLLNESINNMIHLCFDNDISDLKKKSINILSDCETLLGLCKQELVIATNENLYDKMFRLHRENDNFIENYLSLALSYSDYIESEAESISYVGLLYGGLELPFILKLIKKQSFSKIAVLKITNQYFDKCNQHDTQIKLDGFVETLRGEKAKYIHLMDDNILTGRTINRSLNWLLKNHYKVASVFVVRQFNLNRIEQANQEKVHPKIEFLCNFLKGMVYPSLFTKIKVNTNYRGEYLDEIGIFSLPAYEYLKYLYKNGWWYEHSDAFEFYYPKLKVESIYPLRSI